MSIDSNFFASENLHRVIHTTLLLVIAGILAVILYFHIKDSNRNRARFAVVSSDIESVESEVKGLRLDLESIRYQALSTTNPDSLQRKVDNIFIILKRRYIDHTTD